MNQSIERASTFSFVGGPLDGHVEQSDTPLHQMPEVLGIMVSSAIVAMLTTNRLGREVAPTSLAFYQQTDGQMGQYRFVGATSPEAIQWNA